MLTPPGANARSLARPVASQPARHGVSVDPQGSRTDANRKMLVGISLESARPQLYRARSWRLSHLQHHLHLRRAPPRRKSASFAHSVERAHSLLVGFLCGSAVLRSHGHHCGLFFGGFWRSARWAHRQHRQSLYVSSVPAPIQLPVGRSHGVALGLGISLLAALAPALEASLISPIEAMARGREQYVAALRSRRTLTGLPRMLLVGTFAATRWPGLRQAAVGLLAVVLLDGGTSLIIPNIVAFFAAHTTACCKPCWVLKPCWPCARYARLSVAPPS